MTVWHFPTLQVSADKSSAFSIFVRLFLFSPNEGAQESFFLSDCCTVFDGDND